jgi:hypothetical protein
VVSFPIHFMLLLCSNPPMITSFFPIFPTLLSPFSTQDLVRDIEMSILVLFTAYRRDKGGPADTWKKNCILYIYCIV